MADTVDPAVPLSSTDDAEHPTEDEAERLRDGGPGGPEGEAEEPEKDAEEQDGDRSLRELLEQLGHELAELGVSEAQLEAARNLPEVRRAARDTVGAVVVVIAALTGFAFLNVAAVAGLSRVLATWLAALVLAAAWFALGAVLFFCFRRAGRWLLWLVIKAPPREAMEELEQERNVAATAARSTLEDLGPALAVQIALAAVPKAGDVAGGVVSGVLEIGDTVLEGSETVEVIAEELPGGGVANQVWSVALTGGRLGVRVATFALRRRRPADGAVREAGPER